MTYGNEREPLLRREYVLYTRRWYILLAFCMVVTCQNAFWNTFGALEPYIVTRYDTTESMVNFLSALGPIVFIPTSFISVWFVDRFGLRKTVVSTALLCSSGAIIRCIYLPNFKYNIFFPIVGQCLNNAAGPISMILQPKISSIWFGPSERTFATALSFQSNILGLAGSYLLSMLVTQDSEVPYLLYIYAIAGIATFVLVLVYFPDGPPTPPSLSGEKSAASTHDNHPLTVLKNSAKSLTSLPAFILIVFGSCPGGVYSAWGAMLVEIVTPLGYTVNQAEWFGFYAMIAGGVGGIAFGKAHDLYKHYKTWLLGLLSVALCVFVWFTLTMADIIPGAFVGSMVANIVGGFLMGAPSGIVYEGIVELTYPIPEQTGVNVYSILFNLWTLIFLACGGSITPTMMNWILCGSVLITLIALLPLKESYPRSDVDNASVRSDHLDKASIRVIQ